jgi:lipopolysaccharide cholinephosphotransferase
MYSNIDLENLQKELFTLFNNVVKILDDNKISYIMLGGTALGARRHKGFIPWDDDIDIAIKRTDLEKLHNLSETFADLGLFLQSNRTDNEMPYPFIKVRKNDTKFIESYTKHLEIHQGIFIDLFPFDNVCKNDVLFNLNNYRYKLLSVLLSSKLSLKFENGRKNLALRLVKPLSRLFGTKFIHARLDNLYKKRNTGFIGFYGFKRLKIRNDQFDNRHKVEFENSSFYQMDDIDGHLNLYFGHDYMSLPTREKRINHAPIELKF